MDWHNKVLEELIYERVRLHVDLLDLIDFERDLEESIGRALREMGGSADPARITRGYVDSAWRRLEAEWRLERESEEADCPLCAGPFECPAAG